MEGDDAVEFFNKFGEKFHVDLATLHEHWHEHFFPEGFGAPSAGCMVVIGASVIVGGFVHEVVKRIPAWLSMIGAAVLFSWIYGKFFVEQQPGKTPITVQDLVEAASSGKWVKHYDEPAASLFRTLQ
jgi:hypothetical protein